jgi:hypothetical protein
MLTNEWLSVIKAEREREMKAAQRAHLADRNRFDHEAGETVPADIERAIGRIVGPAIQTGRATTDPSL